MKKFIYVFLLSGVLNTPFVPAQVATYINGQCFKAFTAKALKQKDKAQHSVDRKALLSEPQFVFGDNFRKGDFTTEGSADFVVKQMSFNNRRPLGRIIKKINSESAIVEVIDPALGQTKEIKVHLEEQKNGSFYLTSSHDRLWTGIVLQARPDIEAVFSAIKSEKKELTYEELGSLPETSKEQPLKQRGYSSAYTKYVDELTRWNTIRQRFQSFKVNPYKTHIPYLQEFIDPYISYMKKGVEFLPTPKLKKGAIDRLTELENRANKAIRDKTITYQWWLKFIMNLSQTLQYEHKTDRITDNVEEALLEYFPLIIVAPIRGEGGIIAFNETGPVGVHALGLINKRLKVHGHPNYPPFEFTSHDLLHLFQSMQLRVSSFNTGHELFHNRLMDLKKELTDEQRKNVELAYFLLTHEEAYKAFIQNSPQEMRTALKKKLEIEVEHNRFEFKGLKDISNDPKQQEEQISEIIRDFMLVFSRIQKDMALNISF